MSETHLYNPGWDNGQYEVEPDIGKYTPEGSDKEYTEVFDLARFSIRDDPYTQTYYHKHVEGCAAHNCSRAKLPCIKVVATHLLKAKQTNKNQLVNNRTIFFEFKSQFFFVTTTFM